MLFRSRFARFIIVGVLVASLLPGAAWAQDSPSCAPVNAPAPTTTAPVSTATTAASLMMQQNISLPPGKRAVVVLNQKLVAGKGKVGDIVHFNLRDDIRSEDGASILVPKGAELQGLLLESSGPKRYGRPGKLRLTCDALVLPNGQQIPVALVGSGEIKGSNNSAFISVFRYTLDIIGLGYVIAGLTYKPHDSDWFGELSRTILIVGGGALIAAGELLHALFGAFIRGGNVTLEPGKAFVVEVKASSGNTPAPASP